MIEDIFFSISRPHIPVVVTISKPKRSSDDRYWFCNATINGLSELLEIQLHSEGQISVLMLAFEWIRKQLTTQEEVYLLNGEVPLSYTIPKSVPYSYGDDIIEKAEKYIENLVSERNKEWNDRAEEIRQRRNRRKNES